MRFDLILVADTRFPGGTSSAIAHELRALHRAGYRVAVVQQNAAVLKQDRPVNPELAACFTAGLAQHITPKKGDHLRATLAVVHNPYVLLDPVGDWRISAGKRIIVAHQPALDGTGLPYYDPARINANATALFGAAPVWAPISAVSRANMVAAGLADQLTADDWTNLIETEEWFAPRPHPVADRPVIGRHSRPDWAKWPAERTTMLQAYPDDPSVTVKLLGVGDGLRDLMQGAYPANWQTFAFNEIEPRDFLHGIDFFVYYHHPDWVEGFGRTIAEAAAAGCVVILPETFRPSFGESALYRSPAEVLPTVRELYQDWDGYGLQSQMARRWMERRYGITGYLARIAVHLTEAERALAHTPAAADLAAPEAAAPALPERFDLVHLGDFRSVRETAWRVINSVRIEHDLSYTTGLLQVSAPHSPDIAFIHPEIDALVEAGQAHALDPGLPALTTRLLLVHQPERLFDHVDHVAAYGLPRLIAEKILVILDRPLPEEAILARDRLLRASLGNNVVWTATDEAQHAALRALPLNVDAEPWRVAVWIDERRGVGAAGREVPVIGRCGPLDASQWPDAPVLAQAYPHDPALRLRVLGWPHARNLPFDAAQPVEDIALTEMNSHKFLMSLDAFVYFPGEAPSELPRHAIASALVHGKPVYAPGALKAQLGRGPVYCPPEQVGPRVRTQAAAARNDAYSLHEMARDARRRLGPCVHQARLTRLLGRGLTRHAARPDTPPRVLFMSSNGVGLGHLTRLLAIARRLPAPIEPVFLTMSQGLGIVEQLGYPVEYLPFHGSAQCDANHWNVWLTEQLEQILDFHRPRALVFDGGNPYQGMLDALSPRLDTDFIWVRRGMWRDTQNNAAAIRRQRFFDLVIEPAEIAEAVDYGATAYHRTVALKVPPIRLLDDEELLDRTAACAALGLDPDRPACLIQLGAGSNRDIVAMTDTILAELQRHGGVQPVIAEWLIASNALDIWPGVPRLRGFPLSRYFRAFDFTISAAGYNSFNEIMSFGLPAIFIANEHASMDDQAGRARFAQDNDAAFYLPESQAHAIGPLIEALSQARLRDLMQANSQRLSMDNGATTAAARIAAGLV